MFELNIPAMLKNAGIDLDDMMKRFAQLQAYVIAVDASLKRIEANQQKILAALAGAEIEVVEEQDGNGNIIEQNHA